MKKIINFLCAFVVFIALPFALLAQATEGTADPVVASVFNFMEYFQSLAALVPLAVLVSAFINKKLALSGFLKQMVAWIVSIALCFIGWFFDFGIFVGIEWWVVAIYGFAVGLAANGFFDIKLIQAILDAVKLGKK